jgi:hypothetical protein
MLGLREPAGGNLSARSVPSETLPGSPELPGIFLSMRPQCWRGRRIGLGGIVETP